MGKSSWECVVLKGCRKPCAGAARWPPRERPALACEGRTVTTPLPKCQRKDTLASGRDVDRIADEIEEFLTGSRAEVEPDRVLATVMFSDIVDSTRRASEMGDRRWQARLEQHDHIFRTAMPATAWMNAHPSRPFLHLSVVQSS
jgi:class 3 adenylate cyclase